MLLNLQTLVILLFRILEECSDVRQFYRNKYHEVMVDEYQDTNHTQERMLELLSNGGNRFMVGILNSLFIVFVKRIRRFSMRNSNCIKAIVNKGN